MDLLGAAGALGFRSVRPPFDRRERSLVAEVDDASEPDQLRVLRGELAEEDRVGRRAEQRRLPRHRPPGADREVDRCEQRPPVDRVLRDRDTRPPVPGCLLGGSGQEHDLASMGEDVVEDRVERGLPWAWYSAPSGGGRIAIVMRSGSSPSETRMAGSEATSTRYSSSLKPS